MVTIAPKQLHALFIHGIGSQKSGYSDDARKNLQIACANRGTLLYTKEVVYSQIFDVESVKYFKSITDKGSSGNMAQKISIYTMADALQWVQNATARKKVLEKIDEAYMNLRAPGEVVIFAHSLGVMAALEWLRTRTAVKNVRLVSFGSNVNLFHLGLRFTCPVQVAIPGRWLNFWDRDDGIGFMLNTRPEMTHVRDMEVSVGRVLGATGLAHTSFFNDTNFWSTVIPSALNV
jgi:uncharacterized Zn ribbon protein